LNFLFKHRKADPPFHPAVVRMLRIDYAILSGLLVLVGCSGDGTPLPERPTHDDAAESELAVEAVDGVTGTALKDDSLTVRYLARAPITLDATAVDRVPSGEPYRIRHAIREDSLVVELRVEAPSYQPLDTVLAVAWGGSAGIVRVPLTPRPDRVAAGGSGRSGGGNPSPATPPSGGRPSGGMDRSALEAGDRAFSAGDWGGAVRAYSRMPAPRDREADYAFDYELALVRRGISHINLGQWQDALNVLQEAVAFDFREYTAFFYLGQVQCVLGQYEAGRQSLNHIPDWLTLSISEAQRPIVLALIDYQLAMCTYGESRQARTQSELRRLNEQATGEFQRFLDKAEAITPMPPEIQAAVQDARQRLAEIRAPLP
jgi:tetratricopeptide (TPR) repeat protein